MKNNININYAYDTTILPKALLFKPIRFIDYYNIEDPFIKCPAIQDFYRNVFVVPFPVDFYGEFRVEGDAFMCIKSNIDRQFVPDFCLITFNTFDLQIRPLEMFCWSDEECVVDTWGAERSGLLNIAGSLNIRNWIRPIHPAYIIPKDLKNSFVVDIKRGHPWLFLKFNTEKKVELTYNFDQNIIDEGYKMSVSGKFVKGVKKYFKKFAEIRPKKLTK